MPQRKEDGFSAERLTEQEMIEILEDIARNGQNAAARIAAIRQLREMSDGTPAAEGFAALYEFKGGERHAA